MREGAAGRADADADAVTGKLPRRVRLLALQAAIRQAITGDHTYISTGCILEDVPVGPDGQTGHEYCESMTGWQGVKRGGLAKFTGSPCVCPNHRAEAS